MDILQKLKQLGEKIYNEFLKNGDPRIEFLTRGNIKTVEYDEEKDIIKLKEKQSVRRFFDVGETRRFTQTLLVAALAKELVESNKHASLREVYYQLKHTIPYINENTFDEQSESDSVIEDLERALRAIREQFGIVADRKGYLYGDITLKDRNRGDEWNCSKLGLGGWGIPSTIEEIDIVDVNADYVLVVEKDAMFERLIEERFPEKNRALLIATKGQPSRGTRRLIRKLRYEVGLPVYVFTDGDPWGFYIYSVIKRGSMNLAMFSEQLATPDAKFIGLTIDDVIKYDLKDVAIQLKPIDVKRVKELMEYPWFKNKEWQRQFNKMLKLNIKAEQDALAKHSLEFVANKYLPEKIEKGEFLP
ncbi:NEQ542 [Nanoarchaeum equitans Kin4-M]|uniref:Type 2 DNA topoisomerase 6 subunit A n=1 Tax=Nanoarchaeum equitans (strain Kin4-M) TaxID=228908 RepID=Q74M54_NANEQ|nr:NEQ542 [Nanoarchaeum equitans Kin4-M]